MKTVQSNHTYHIERLLGRGGLGEVYEAWFEQADGSRGACAVKFLQAEYARNLNAQGRFVQEALLTWQVGCDHPNLVSLRDYDFSDASRPFIVLDFVDGPNLGEIKDELQGRYGLIQALAYDVLSALHHVHASGLVHRDIAPGNILLSPDGVAQLTDLGLAKPQDDAVTFGALGAARYAAPEVIRREAYSTASDLYSLGVVVLELIYGTLPKGAGQGLPANTPESLRAFVLGVLEAEPDDRISLEEAAASLGPPEPTEGKLSAIVEGWQTRRRRRISGAATQLALQDTVAAVERARFIRMRRPLFLVLVAILWGMFWLLSPEEPAKAAVPFIEDLTRGQ